MIILFFFHTTIASKDNNPHPQKSLTYTKNPELGCLACSKVLIFITLKNNNKNHNCDQDCHEKKLDNLDRSKVIIPLPVRVDQVVPKRPTTK